VPSTSQLAQTADEMTVIENLPVVHVLSDVGWTSGAGTIQVPATFSRNLTNNP
jgi:hypothetical protein